MAIKTFTTGEVLTASDTNTYLANSGLVYVTSTTFSGSSTVQVSNCFTSTYDHYKIILSAYGSANSFAKLQLTLSGTPATSSYYRTGFYAYSAGLANYSGGPEAQIQPISAWNTGTGSGMASSLEILNPAKANKTAFDGFSLDPIAPTIYKIFSMHDTETAYDGFKLFPNSGTMTGTVTVYGYRKA